METLQQRLIRHEGLRLKPYRDLMGILTIGVGRNLDQKGLSEREALWLLGNDIEDCWQQVLARLPWAKHLDQIRMEVLIEMAFQLGIEGLMSFTVTLGFVELHKYEAAAQQMLMSKVATTQAPQRWKELSEMMRTGLTN